MSPPAIDSAVQVIAGDERLRRRLSHTGPGPLRPLIVSNLKWGTHVAATTCFRGRISNLAPFIKAHCRYIVFPVHGSTGVVAARSAPYLTRETISGRRPVDGANTPGGVFRPGEPSLGAEGKIKSADAVEIHR